MLAKNVMTKDVVTVAPDTPVAEIAKLLLDRRVSGVPVVDAGQRLVGIVSEGDLMRRVGAEVTESHRSWWLEVMTSPDTFAHDFVKAHGCCAADVMTRDVVAVDEDTPVHEIARTLEAQRIKRVPVLRDGKLVGIVSRANLLHALAIAPAARPRPGAGDQSIREALYDYLLGQPWFSAASINIVVDKGVVEFWGLADSSVICHALDVAAKEVAGVTEVRNHVSTKPRFVGYGV